MRRADGVSWGAAWACCIKVASASQFCRQFPKGVITSQGCFPMVGHKPPLSSSGELNETGSLVSPTVSDNMLIGVSTRRTETGSLVSPYMCLGISIHMLRSLCLGICIHFGISIH